MTWRELLEELQNPEYAKCLDDHIIIVKWRETEENKWDGEPFGGEDAHPIALTSLLNEDDKVFKLHLDIGGPTTE